MLLNLKHKGFFAVFSSGYRVSKIIVWFVCAFLLLYNVFALNSILGHERFYVENPYPVAVENPFYLSDNNMIPSYINNMEFLPGGFSAGYDHGVLVASAPVFSLLFLLLAALLNHFLFNKWRMRVVNRWA